jgi:hypothetical protein
MTEQELRQKRCPYKKAGGNCDGAECAMYRESRSGNGMGFGFNNTPGIAPVSYCGLAGMPRARA